MKPLTPREDGKYFKWCVDRGITIYPIPQDNKGTVLKIAVCNKGDEQVGDKTYSNAKVYDKIRELYKHIYEKNNP